MKCSLKSSVVASENRFIKRLVNRILLHSITIFTLIREQCDTTRTISK